MNNSFGCSTFIFFYLILISQLSTSETTQRTEHANATLTNCSVGQHSCHDGKCIPQKYVCDGDFDCDDHSDESSDCPPHTCNEGHMRCSLTGRCLPLRYKCDLEFDCGVNDDGLLDTSDEDPTVCNTTRVCPAGEHMCASGGQCVHLSKFCNGYRDCADGSDEHAKCGVPPSANDIACKYGGSMTLERGLQCYCPVGQQARGSECEDEDECARVEFGGVPVCAQICVNLIAKRAGDERFRCACLAEFELVNNTWCRFSKTHSSYTDPSVLLYGKHQIVHKKLDDLKGVALDSIAVSDLQTMAVDIKKRRLCWVTSRAVNMLDGVSCINIDSNGKFTQPIRSIEAAFTVEGVKAMCFDWIGRNWYMADNLYSSIFVCNSEFDRCITLNSGKIVKPSSIAVDSAAGYIFLDSFIQTVFCYSSIGSFILSLEDHWV